MANNYGTYTAQFSPFTYDEMIKPVLMSEQSHREMEQSLGEIDGKRALIEGALDPDRDSIAYLKHNDYLEGLQEASNTLASLGVKGMDRRNINQLRTKYNSEIVPIERAILARHALALLESQKSAQDDSTIFTRRALDMSVDEFLANPELNPLSVSGRNLYATSAQAFSNLTRRLKAEGFTPSQAKGYLRLYKSRGYTEQQALKAMLGEGASKEFDQIFNNVAESYGINDWEEGAPKEKAMENIYRGALSAIGQDDTQYMSDRVLEYSQLAAKASGRGSDPKNPNGVVARRQEKGRALSDDLVKERAENFKYMTDYFSNIKNSPIMIEGTKDSKSIIKYIKEDPKMTVMLGQYLEIPESQYENIEQYLPETKEGMFKFMDKAVKQIKSNTISVTESIMNSANSAHVIDNINQYVTSLGTPSIANAMNPKMQKKKNYEDVVTPIKEIKRDGTLGKGMTAKEVTNILNSVLKNPDASKASSAHISYMGKEQVFRMNVTNEDGEIKVFAIPPEIVLQQIDGYSNINLGQRLVNNILEAANVGTIDDYYNSIDTAFASIHNDANTFMLSRGETGNF